MEAGALYAVAFSILNLFGCFALPKWVVDGFLDERAAVVVPRYDRESRAALPGLPGYQSEPAPQPSKIGELHLYFGARLTVEYDKKGRAIGVAPFRSP